MNGSGGAGRAGEDKKFGHYLNLMYISNKILSRGNNYLKLLNLLRKISEYYEFYNLEKC